MTEQLALFPLIGASDQAVESNDPWPVGLADQATLPIGKVFDPELLSMTVAVQVLAAPITDDKGKQERLVCVVRAVGVVPLTVALAPVPLPGVIEIVAEWDPKVFGLNVTVNVALPFLGTSMNDWLTTKFPSEDATTALLALVSLFDTVKVCWLLDSPTPVLPKLEDVGLTERLGGSNCVEALKPDVAPDALTV